MKDCEQKDPSERQLFFNEMVQAMNDYMMQFVEVVKYNQTSEGAATSSTN